MPSVSTWRWGAAIGVGAGLLYAAAPLSILTVCGAAVLMAVARRDVPPLEQRRIVTIIGIALLVRFLLISLLLVSNIPHLSDLGVGGLAGDDAYYLGRAIRARDILVGVTQGRYDYFVVSDEYGRTSYLQLLTALQVLFGPTPYSIRAMNSLLFVTAAYLLFRLCRPGFGATAAALALIALLFLPSLLVSSLSTSKEPSYFFVTTVMLTAAVAVIRQPRTIAKVAAVITVLVCLWILDDLRRGALALGVSGLVLAIAARLMLQTRRRALAGAAIAAVAIVALAMQPSIRARALDATASVAKMHAGHVFTSGHAYKLLDDGFYMHPGTPAAWPLKLTGMQAGRFLVRAAASFIVTPLPWEMASISELIFFPEHLLWLLVVLFVPIGAIVGWQRDSTITACLLGFAIPTAAVLAVTTGNVGTLLRLRGLVTPYLLWFAVLGGLAVCERLLMRSRATAFKPAEALS